MHRALLLLLGVTWSQMGEYSRAQACFERANELQPDHPPFMLNLANNLVYHGDAAAAETDHRHIGEMARLAAGLKQHPRSAAFYWYAIGKELEDLEDWDDAFEAFARGAAARRSTVEYDEAAEIAMFDYLEHAFDANWFAEGARGEDNPAPIFVLGQPRTGTTLVERIIAAHSRVHSAGELQQFGLAVRRLANYTDPRRFSREYFEAARGLEPQKVGALYLQTTARQRGDTPHFVDKLPQNYLLLPLILKALPNARIVHLVRDPMDACFASFKQLFADAYLHSYTQEETARHHARYRRLMQTWRERFPGRFYDVHYEEIAANLEPGARALLDYLELPWEDACLEFHRQAGAVSTASAAQVREPAHTRSIGRWRRYERQLAPMRAELERALADSG